MNNSKNKLNSKISWKKKAIQTKFYSLGKCERERERGAFRGVPE